MKLDTDPIDNGQFHSVPLPCDLLPSLAQKLCKTTRDEQREVHEEPINLRLSTTLRPPTGKDNAADKKKKHETDKSDRKLDQQLREQLAAKLNRDASTIQPVTVKGLKFTRNERMKIIAAISLAEGSFISMGKDYEFHMSRERAAQIPVSYYGVVHIGLSWGLIQFTQDSGSLGGLLQHMHDKNPAKFTSIFGSASDELIRITTATGKEESGQVTWKNLPASEQAKQRESRKEIRGLRVQKVPIVKGGEKKDLWEEPWLSRLKQAGLDEEFQELQMEYAVNKYINLKNILSFIKINQVQTALGIALVVDRAIQAKPENAHKVISSYAKQGGIALPFTGPAQERNLAHYIAENSTATKDHKRRVKLLLEDKYRLLTVNLYDWDTYEINDDR